MLKKHLEGKAADASGVIGIYPLLSDDTCRFFVVDFDNHEKDADKEGNRHLWARGYYCETVGNVNEETIKKYIQDQYEKDKMEH